MKTTRHFLNLVLLMAMTCAFPMQTIAKDKNYDYKKKYKEAEKSLKKIEEEITNLYTIIEELKIQLDDNSNSRSNKESYNEQFDDTNQYDDKGLEELVNNIGEKWLNKSYIDIHNKFSELEQDMELLKSHNHGKKIKEAYNKLKKLKDELLIYNQAVAAVNNQYDSNVVEDLRPKVKRLSKKAYIKDFKNDLVWQLDNYKDINELYEEAIKKIDEYKKANKNVSNLKLKAFIEKNKLTEHIKYINQIPYLNNEFKKHYNPNK